MPSTPHVTLTAILVEAEIPTLAGFPMVRAGFRFWSVLLIGLLLPACGYRLSGGNIDTGRGRTLAVPVFVNQTTDFRIEQRLTAAVRRELIQRTEYELTNSSSADVVLTGEVLSITTTPILFTPEGRGTAYNVAVDVGVRFFETGTGRILFENPHWVFRDQFELANDSESFVAEDTAAMERLARSFSERLVASIFESGQP
jgi:hypothetical protein